MNQTRQLFQTHARSLETPDLQSGAKSDRMTRREQENYSITRALDSATIESYASVNLRDHDPIPPQWAGIVAPPPAKEPRQVKTGMEVEVSDSLSRDCPLLPSLGVNIPFSVLARALTPTSFGAGGATVGTVGLPPEGAIFPLSRIWQLGAKTVTDLTGVDGGQGNIFLPVVTSSQEGQWCNDTETASRSDIAVASRNATPHRLVFQQKVSRQLRHQTKNADQLVAMILMAPVAASIDRAALAGTGGVQPLGILNTPGVNSVSMGGAPTLSKLNDVEGGVIASNFDPATSAYVVSANTRKKTKNTQKGTNTSTYLLETAGGLDFLNGHPAYSTTYMPDNGGGSTLGSLTFGDFSRLILCAWSGLNVVVDPYTLALQNQELWTITGYFDCVYSRPAAFAVSTDVVTS